MNVALPTLGAETIFHIGSFPVVNTYLNSTATVVLFAVIAFFVSRNIREVPRGIHNFFEGLIELMLKYVDQVTGDRKKSLRYLPIVGTLFLFIMISNWIGILPGIGSIGVNRVAEGAKEFIPLFRSANTDLNLTLAMAVFGVILSHLLGIFTIGFFRYANKFFKFGDLFSALKTMNPVKIFTAVIEFGVGLIEVISELAKFLSLSLRLFGNVFAGEVLLTVLGGIIAVFVPLPFIALEILVGFIQAVVFSMLVLVYISVATTPIEAHGGHDKGHSKHGEGEDHELAPTPTA